MPISPDESARITAINAAIKAKFERVRITDIKAKLFHFVDLDHTKVEGLRSVTTAEYTAQLRASGSSEEEVSAMLEARRVLLEKSEFTESERELLQAHPDILSGLNADHNTYLLEAIAKNNTQSALALIPLCSVEALQKTDNLPFGHNSPLLLAMKKGNTAVALALIAREPALVNTKDFFGMTPLHWAAILRNDEVITKLLDAGAQDSLSKPFTSSPGVTARELYERTFSKDDIMLNPTDYRAGQEDQAGLRHLKLHCLSDLFWHARDIVTNLGQASALFSALDLPSSYDLNLHYTATPHGRRVSAAAREIFREQRAALQPSADISARLGTVLVAAPETVSPNAVSRNNSDDESPDFAQSEKHQEKRPDFSVSKKKLQKYKALTSVLRETNPIAETGTSRDAQADASPSFPPKHS